MAEGGWVRVRRLDIARALAAVRVSAGVDLASEGPCGGGQVGAHHVRWPDGRRGVLTWQPGGVLTGLRRQQLPVREVLRCDGYPAPALDLAVEHEGVVVLVWQLLPGRDVDQLTAGLFDQTLALNRAQAGALRDHPDVPLVNLHLTGPGPGFCLHEPLSAHSQRSAALLDWVHTVGLAHGDALEGVDAVHYDFQPTNFLVHHGRISGVVDWDGAGRGDARLDLVTLRFGLHSTAAGADVLARLDQLLDAMPRAVLAPSWAHMSLRMVDWSIRHHDDESTQRWLDLAARRAR